MDRGSFQIQGEILSWLGHRWCPLVPPHRLSRPLRPASGAILVVDPSGLISLSKELCCPVHTAKGNGTCWCCWALPLSRPCGETADAGPGAETAGQGPQGAQRLGPRSYWLVEVLEFSPREDPEGLPPPRLSGPCSSLGAGANPGPRQTREEDGEAGGRSSFPLGKEREHTADPLGSGS